MLFVNSATHFSIVSYATIQPDNADTTHFSEAAERGRGSLWRVLETSGKRQVSARRRKAERKDLAAIMAGGVRVLDADADQCSPNLDVLRSLLINGQAVLRVLGLGQLLAFGQDRAPVGGILCVALRLGTLDGLSQLVV